MLTFLRKHQRIFFMIVAAVTIASFLFFGTANQMVKEEKSFVDKERAQAVDGSSIMESETQAMLQFFSWEMSDFIQKDLLSTGLGVIVAEKYFDQIKDEFKERLERAQHSRPYAHPEAPFLNVQEIWQRFAPEMAARVAHVKESPLSPESFALFSRLYLDQTLFSPALLHKILMYQQRQFEWIHNDPSLSEERLSLFGFRSLEDWFGPTYLEKVTLLVINAAKIAEGKGYKISKKEVKADLLQHTLTFLKTSLHQENATYREAHDFLRHQLYIRQMDEQQVYKVWKNILLFRRLFDEVGQGMFLDNLVYHQFAEYAGETVSIERYQLPALLRFQNLRDFLKFHYYVDAVAPKTKAHLTKLPLYFYEVAEVEKRCPQLVCSKFYLEVSKVRREALTQKITLKETWNWEASAAGRDLLVKEFPVLEKSNLDALESSLRLKIDTFAREQIVGEHPEWFQEAMERTDAEKVHVRLTSQGATPPFDDIDNGAKLAELLQGIEMGGKASFFSPDKKSYYVVTVLEKPAKKEIMTFEEALQGDWIGKLLDKKLEEAYPEVRKKDPSLFQLSNGSWKAFKNVYDEVGALVYQDALKSVPSDKLIAFMEEARKSVIKEGEASVYLTSQGDPLKDQWKLIKCSQDVKRSDKTTFAKGKMFEALSGEWSQVLSSIQGDITFFKLIKKTAAPDSITDQINEGQKFLSMDAKRLLMNQVLSLMEEGK